MANIKKVYSKSKYVRMSPQKVRLVVDLIRGENAEYASEMLTFVNKAAALPVKKAVDAAIANAENNHEMDGSELSVVEARVDEAPTYKRGRAVSKGRYHQILKRNSHIVIAVSDGKQVKSKPAKKTKAKETVEGNKPKTVKKTPKKVVKKPEIKKGVSANKDLTKNAQVKSTGTQRRVQAKG